MPVRILYDRDITFFMRTSLPLFSAAALCLLLTGAGCQASLQPETTPTPNMMQAATNTMMKATSTSMEATSTMMKKDPVKDAVMKKTGSYEAYDVSKLQNASTGNVVLFFNASWCPSCQAVNADILSKISSIPKNLTILSVDYDSSSALKQKYGVTYQHTFVQVDARGELIQKWSGSPTLQSIISKVN